MTKEIELNAFDMNCVVHHQQDYGHIRATEPTTESRLLDEIAQILEHGKFECAFHRRRTRSL